MNVIGASMGVAAHSETDERLVITISSRTGTLWATPAEGNPRWRESYSESVGERAHDERDALLVTFQVGVYRHHKGQHYQAIGLALDEVDGTLYVVYVSLEGAALPGPRLRVRPAYMFADVVVSDGGHACLQRFRYVGDEIPRP